MLLPRSNPALVCLLPVITRGDNFALIRSKLDHKTKVIKIEYEKTSTRQIQDNLKIRVRVGVRLR